MLLCQVLHVACSHSNLSVKRNTKSLSRDASFSLQHKRQLVLRWGLLCIYHVQCTCTCFSILPKSSIFYLPSSFPPTLSLPVPSSLDHSIHPSIHPFINPCLPSSPTSSSPPCASLPSLTASIRLRTVSLGAHNEVTFREDTGILRLSLAQDQVWFSGRERN